MNRFFICFNIFDYNGTSLSSGVFLTANKSYLMTIFWL